MAGVGNTLENLAIDWMLVTGTPSRPAATWLALFTTNPDFETGAGGTEAAPATRKAISFNAASGGSAASSNSQVWTCGTDLNAGTITGWAIYSASSAGTFLFGGTISSGNKTVASGDTLTFSAGAITFSLD